MLRVVLFMVFAAASTLAHNILVVVPVPSKSHVLLFEPLVYELANRGHRVTYISAHDLPKPHPNITDITIPTVITGPDGKPLNFLDIRQSTALDNILVLPKIGLVVTEQLISHERFQQFLREKPKFDLLISEAFLSEGLMSGLSRYFNVPNVGYATFMPSAWTNYMVGNVAPSSFIPDPLLGHPYRMNFIQRAENFLFNVVADLHRAFIYLPAQDRIMRKYFGDEHPYVGDIIRNTSVLLINDHLSTSFPRPVVPNLVGIGGLHVKPPKPLPDDLKAYLDNSKNGAILFSLGSIITAARMPEEKIRMFLNVFGQLKENVLWKFESNLQDIPKNIKISKWLPQADILAHPNVKLFITHGGLLSTTEAVNRGVPVVGIPLFGDQPMNMRQSVNAGVGLSLPFDELTSEQLLKAIREVIDEPSYRIATKLRSARYHDRPVQPMELAMYWIDYVIRHKGADHLRSVAQDLHWYQLYQLDVIAALLISILSVIFVIKYFLCKLITAVCGRKELETKKRN